MRADQRQRSREHAVRSSDAALEREWLTPIDVELAAFAEEIGAQVEYNPDGYARRRLFKHHRNGVVREIWIMAWQGMGLHLEVRANVTDEGELKQMGRWIADGIECVWEAVEPLLKRGWRRLMRTSKSRIIRVWEGRESAWVCAQVLGSHLSPALRASRLAVLREQRRKARVEAIWLTRHDADFERLATDLGVTMDRNRGLIPSRYFVLELHDGVHRLFCVSPSWNPEKPGPVNGLGVRASASLNDDDLDNRRVTAVIAAKHAPNDWSVLSRLMRRLYQEVISITKEDLERQRKGHVWRYLAEGEE